MMTSNRRLYFLDALWLLALAVYVLAGVDRVPFHGDESMLINMSQDYAYLVQQHTAQPIKYDPDHPDPAQQELRILNGTTGKMAMGLAWDVAGYELDDLNDPWWWGFYDPQGNWNEWTWNIYDGHMPSDGLLRSARVSSAVLGIIGLWAIFALTWGVTGSRWPAYAATLILVTTPPVTLNIRRAMMEGSLLAFTSLTMLAALWVIREQGRHPRRRGAWIASYVALGVTSGLAISSKHTGGMAVFAAFLAVLLASLPWRRVQNVQTETVPFPYQGFSESLLGLTLAGLLTLGTFLLLNPVWWSDPLHMPERVITLRQDVIDKQTIGAKNDGTYYEQFGDRVDGLIQQAFLAEPEFYEVGYWQQFIGDEIGSYRSSGLAGRLGGIIWGAVLMACLSFGLNYLFLFWRRSALLLIVIWMVVTVLIILVTTPFEWQRYYLPLQPPLAILCGIGLWHAANMALEWLRWRQEGKKSEE